MCAPAGSGKTVLLRSWVEAAGPADRVAWVSVERGERDAQRFWLSVIDALAGAAGDGSSSGSAPRRLRRPRRSSSGCCPTSRALEEPVVLVIDDLHELRSADALRLARAASGASCRRSCGSCWRRARSRALGLHRLRLAGELTEIRGPDLRFSLEETRELLDASGIALSDDGSALLHERTEGWAGGPAAGGDLARPASRTRSAS